MRRFNRYVLILYSFVVALIGLLLLLQLLNISWGVYYIGVLENIAGNPAKRLVMILVLAIIVALAVLTVVMTLLNARLGKTRISTNDIGIIDIGVDAIESIALNAAKAAQGGVKSAKARVTQAKSGSLSLVMVVQLYSGVEIPTQMAKIQDRVKKDVERYTGIPVTEVQVKVVQVELVGAKVER